MLANDRAVGGGRVWVQTPGVGLPRACAFMFRRLYAQTCTLLSRHSGNRRHVLATVLSDTTTSQTHMAARFRPTRNLRVSSVPTATHTCSKAARETHTHTKTRALHGRINSMLRAQESDPSCREGSGHWFTLNVVANRTSHTRHTRSSE